MNKTKVKLLNYKNRKTKKFRNYKKIMRNKILKYRNCCNKKIKKFRNYKIIINNKLHSYNKKTRKLKNR